MSQDNYPFCILVVPVNTQFNYRFWIMVDWVGCGFLTPATGHRDNLSHCYITCTVQRRMAGGWVIVCIVFCHWMGENAHILLHELSHMYTYLIYICIYVYMTQLARFMERLSGMPEVFTIMRTNFTTWPRLAQASLHRCSKAGQGWWPSSIWGLVKFHEELVGRLLLSNVWLLDLLVLGCFVVFEGPLQINLTDAMYFQYPACLQDDPCL